MKKNKVSLEQEMAILSNERTMLSDFRTAFAAFILGLALLNFLSDGPSFYLGLFFLAVGFIFIIYGVISYNSRNRRILGR